jgi:phosphatidylglycerol---prolipoprotein diacylglyceryl transferase
MMSGLVYAAIPSPSSGVLEIGPLELRAYGLMIALGVVAAVWLFGRRLEAAGVGTRDDASAVALWGVPAGIIGARLYHVATDWHRFSDDFWAIFKIWKGGLGIPGGMALGILVGVWALWRRGIPLGPALTAVAPALPLAQAIGRWGNWFNQELFGRPTDLPWALKIDDDHLPDGYPPGTTFHPTFLYESLWNLALCGLLIWIGRRFRLRPGRLLAVYVLGYGIGRFWVEGLRIDESKEGGGLRLNQWMALVVAVGAAAYLLVDWLRHRNDAPVEQLDPDAAEGEAGEDTERDVVEGQQDQDIDVDDPDQAEPADDESEPAQAESGDAEAEGLDAAAPSSPAAQSAEGERGSGH